jgi:hypothetical protein
MGMGQAQSEQEWPPQVLENEWLHVAVKAPTILEGIDMRSLFLAVVAATAFATPGSMEAQASSCGVVGTGDGASRLQSLKETLMEPDTVSVLYRQDFGLVGIDSSAVQIVTDTTVCSAVTAVIDSKYKVPIRSGPLVVLKVGPRYLAYKAEGGDTATFFLDLNYAWIAVTVVP